MNQLWIYMYSPSRSPLLPPSLPDSSGSSQCTTPELLKEQITNRIWVTCRESDLPSYFQEHICYAMQNSNWTSKVSNKEFISFLEKKASVYKPPLLILNGVTFDSDAGTQGGRECEEFELICLQYGVPMEPWVVAGPVWIKIQLKMGAGGEGDNRGWDGWMASPTQQTWVWVNSGS